ncbi:MAG: 5-bromo-4-chloroindolyl phosphate hydrolysis family protein, partial [Lachnospiraceae bacterium]|nr:5-bromo-4-chloroindolyl phosphate hydrolysis family protein [Lachnospiraceae bacterium]
PTPFVSKNVSKNTGIGSMITGSMGMAASGVMTLLMAIGAASQAAAGVAVGLAGGIILGGGVLITGAFGLLFSHGKNKKDIVADYYNYGKYVGNAEFFKIEELAARLGLQEGKLKKRLKKMMNQGLLPSARMDDSGEMLLLTDKAYDQYRQAADSYKKRQQEDEKRENYFNLPDADSTVKELLSEGAEYLKKVRYYNDLIPDTLEMSNKLYRLENIMYRIFEQVKKKPEMAPSLRKFMEYYLPTTEKLLSAYIEVDKQPQVGDNITNTKKEIETALDTINDAFEKLLDSLFEDLAWDISSDISVMKTMLEQDGLT